jgi:hypothetical protein
VPELPGNDRRMVERRKLVLVVDASEPHVGMAFNSVSSRPRRSGLDRRRGERRVLNLDVERDRRSGKDRRHRYRPDRRGDASRRMTVDRRDDGPAVFTREEAGIICKRALVPGPVACPRCNGHLTIRPPISSSDGAVWQVRCLMCRRCLMIRNL